MRGQRHAPAALYPWERPGTHCTGGWVGPRAVMDRCGKSCPQLGFDPRTVQPIASHYTDWSTWLTNIPIGWSLLQEWNNSNTFVVTGNKILDFLHAYCNHKEVNFYQIRKKCLMIIPQEQQHFMILANKWRFFPCNISQIRFNAN